MSEVILVSNSSFAELVVPGTIVIKFILESALSLWCVFTCLWLQSLFAHRLHSIPECSVDRVLPLRPMHETCCHMHAPFTTEAQEPFSALLESHWLRVRGGASSATQRQVIRISAPCSACLCVQSSSMTTSVWKPAPPNGLHVAGAFLCASRIQACERCRDHECVPWFGEAGAGFEVLFEASQRQSGASSSPRADIVHGAPVRVLSRSRHAQLERPLSKGLTKRLRLRGCNSNMEAQSQQLDR